MPTRRGCRMAAVVVATGLAAVAVASSAQTTSVPAPGAAPPSVGSDAGPVAAPATAVAVPPDVASYDVGLMLGRQLYQNGLNDTVSRDALIRGLKDGLSGTLATNEQRADANQFIRAGREAVTARNRKEAEAFLERNAKVDGVRTTASGLQYRILADGDPQGQPPRANDQVTVQYHAALADGVEFDSSYAHGQPATLQLRSVVKGWREALLMMRPGARWQLFVPPDLAYGNSPPPAVPPGALLIYQLELVRVESPPRVDPKAPQAPTAKGHQVVIAPIPDAATTK